MDREKLLLVVRAAMSAAAAIVRVTPNTTDDRIYDIAQVIVDQVLKLFADTGVYLEPGEEDFVKLAVFQIQNAIGCEGDDCVCE